MDDGSHEEQGMGNGKATRRLRIAGFPNNEGFCNFYRITNPLEALSFEGKADIKIIHQSRTIEVLEACAWADVLIFQYASPYGLIQKVQDLIIEEKLPKIVVCDFDDDLFSIDTSNPAYKIFGTEEVWYEKKDGSEKVYLWKDGEKDFDKERNKKMLEELTKAVMVCDLVITSTKPIADSFKKLNDNIIVLNNCIQPISMVGAHNLKQREFFEQVVIGWQGSDSHYKDIRKVISILERLQKKYGNAVKFRFFGARFDELYKNLDHEIIPWIKPHLFYDRFAANLFDIGIIPLEDTSFNRCKSNIKWLENSYYRIPCVVADVTPYKETVSHKINGLKYRTLEEMFQNLCLLVEDKLYRQKIASCAQDFVLKHYNINKQAYRWLKIFELSIEDKKKSLGIA